MEKQTFNVEVTKKDLEKLNHYLFIHKKLLRNLLLYPFVVIAIALPLSFQGGFMKEKLIGYGAETALFLLFALIIISILQYYMLRSYARNNKHFLGKRTITFDHKGITEKGSDSKIAYRWNRIKKIALYQNALYIISGKSSVILIPEHTFTRIRDAKSIYKSMKRFHALSGV